MRPMHGGCGWALVAAVVAPVLAAVVWAGPAAAETTLEVDAGYAGSFVPGQEVPVRVRVSADRLVRGTLEVGVGRPEDGVPVSMAVEVPGGSQKEFLIAAPSGFDQGPDVVATLHQGDQLVASGQTSIRVAADTELVGILPGALGGRPVPGAAPLAVDAGTARFAAVGAAAIEQAPASLGPLSTLAADVDEIAGLSPGARAGVLRWIDDGGRLLVDAARGQAVPGLPDAWQPGPRGRAAAGMGEVVATDGAIAAGRWAGLVEPSGRAMVSRQFGGELPLATTLASDAGLRTPKIAWLVGFLAVYVILVGPVLFFAVRRRGRPELAWVAVPLVALLFTSGSWAVGRNLRKATELVHASVLSTGAGGPVATSYVGVFSRSGETARIGFPAGWSSGTFSDLGQPATPSLLTRTQDGTEVRLPLDTGQFGMVQATGPAPAEVAGGLEITAGAEPGGRIPGAVRNHTPFQLDQVAVFAGADVVLVGDLGPGEELPFVLTDAGLGRMGGPGGAEFRVWGGPRLGTPESVADFGLWQAALRSGGANFLSPAAVVAAGWTRDYQPEIRVSGRSAQPGGRTLVVGRHHVPPPTTGSTTTAARRDIVRDPFGNRFGPGFNPGRGAGSGSVVRFVLPDGADTSKLVLRSPFGGAELWQDGAWQPATCEGPNCEALGPVPGDCPPGVPCRAIGRPFPMAVDLTVPASSVREGVVYVRVPGPASLDQPFPLSIGRGA